MESPLKKYLGKKVKVIVDRPLGSKHPDFGWTYPINYGYLPNVKSGDGEEIDAFILGVDKPLKEFEGTVIAIVHRLDDNEDKLVVAPEGKDFSKEEIEKLLHFQEKFFKSEIIKMRSSKFLL
jgi:inorganic pyrophosphatase